MHPISDIFNAFVGFVFGVSSPAPPVDFIQREIFTNQEAPEPLKPAPYPSREHIPAPHYMFGASDYKLGTWKTKAEAHAAEIALRLEVQHRDPDVRFYESNGDTKQTLSEWGIRLMVVPDIRNTWSLFLYGVYPTVGEQFCHWVSHDSGPYSQYEDGRPWVAWPAWTSRGKNRFCKQKKYY